VSPLQHALHALLLQAQQVCLAVAKYVPPLPPLSPLLGQSTVVAQLLQGNHK
jgi:hypothetical protein